MLTMQLNASLEKLAKEKPQYKGRGKLTEQMRKRLAGSMRSAIISRSKLSDKTKAAWLLQKDILNCALHCFGSHKKCSADFCKVVQKVQSSQCKETSLASVMNSQQLQSLTHHIVMNCFFPTILAQAPGPVKVSLFP